MGEKLVWGWESKNVFLGRKELSQDRKAVSTQGSARREKQRKATEDTFGSTYSTRLLLEDTFEDRCSILECVLGFTWSWRHAVQGRWGTPWKKQPEHLAARANKQHSINSGRRGEGSPWRQSRHFSRIFSIITFHLTLEAVVSTNINETHFVATSTFLWTTSKSRDTNLLFLHTAG